jgi:hypothetical protein
MSLRLKPITITEAKAAVGRWHRHAAVPQGGLFAVGCSEVDGELCGVAIVGRPIARLLDDGETCEVTRVATNGTRNACSILYGAACRAAKALGYNRIVTYTLAEESGASLRASGWNRDADVPASTWDRPNRHRVQTDMFGNDRRPPGPKVRWAKQFKSEALPSSCG